MKFATEGHIPLCMVQLFATQAYGIKDSQYKSVIEFDAMDKWVGIDFDLHLEKIIDTFFDKIEEDLLSVWSTNKSEQESANLSA